MVKLTFSLDEATVRMLRRVAEQKRKAQSLVVREAIVEYAAREERLSEDERVRRLGVIRDLKAQLVKRSAREVEQELSELRRRRNTGWERPSD